MRPPRPPGPGFSPWPPAPHVRREERRPPPPDQYGSFRASLLYCPTCRQATPTRERLLLVLPAGELYEYLCAQCGTSTGSKTDKNGPEVRLVIP